MEEPLNITKTLYTVSDFLEWQRAKQLNLRPYFQRGSVWTPKAKSYLIDTLLRGFPIPIIYLQQKTDRTSLKSVRQIVDGQQRLRTILSYVDPSCLQDFEPRDSFTLMRAHNAALAGRPFEKLPPNMQDRLINTELSVHVIPSNLEDEILLQIFARLNSTGTKLNDQELRNADYHGEFKTLMYRLSYAQLDRWKEWGPFSPQALAQMREVEFMSDLVMALVVGPSGRSKAAIDNFYKENDDEFPEADRVASVIPELFDEMAFLLAPDARGESLGALQTQSWIFTLVSYLALSKYQAPLRASKTARSGAKLPPASKTQLRRSLVRVQERLRSGDVPRGLADSLRGASTDRGSRQHRLDFLVSNLGA